MKKIRRWLSDYWPFLAAALLLAIPLMIALRDVVRDVIVYPLARLFWLAQLVFQSIPPIFIWGYFLLIALRIVMRGVRKTPNRSQTKRSKPTPSSRRVGKWARRIQLTSRGDYSLWRTAHQLGDLAVEVIASDEHIDAEESRRRLQTGDWDAPDEIRDYFRRATRPVLFPRQLSFLARWWRWLIGRPSEKPQSLDVELSTVVAFLEDRAGIGELDGETQ